MKKALAILMILALVGSAAFAEITFGAWGRGIFTPVANSGASGAKNMMALGETWSPGAGNARVGFTVAGNSDNAGFQFDVYNDAPGDQIKIWVKPMDKVTVTMGKFFDDTLRGNAAFGSFNWIRDFGGDQGEDITFTRFASGADTSKKNYNSTPDGFLVTAKPTDAIFVGAAICSLNGIETSKFAQNIQIAGGYTIANVGLLRAQYYSAPKTVGTDTKADATVEVAFKLTAIQNLYADFGFRMFTLKEHAATPQENKEKDLSAYANYKMDKATIHGLALYDLNAVEGKKAKMNIGAGVDYALDGGIGVEADVRYYDKNWNKAKLADPKAATTFFAGVKKGFSNGLIGIGFEVQNAKDTAYAIPVRMEYWF